MRRVGGLLPAAVAAPARGVAAAGAPRVRAGLAADRARGLAGGAGQHALGAVPGPRPRQHGPAAAGDADPLITALTRLYAYLSRADEDSVRPAARLRAEAMDLSDQWVAAGGAPDSPLIAAERATLVRSYAALLSAVHRA